MDQSAHILSLRLSPDDAHLMAQLQVSLGVSKSAVVKRALRLMAEQLKAEPQSDAFAAGAGLFGRYGDEQRQAADIKQLVRQRLASKRAAADSGQ
jgi:hypothetical protein